MVPLPLEPEMCKKNIQFPTIATSIVLEETITPVQLTMKYGKSVPYDAYLPSCQNKVKDQTCKVCDKYHATKKSLNVHKKVCKRAKIRSTDPKRICNNSWTSTVNNFIDINETDENNSDDNSEEDDDVISVELVNMRPNISLQGDCGVETILNLWEWLKFPWCENE